MRMNWRGLMVCALAALPTAEVRASGQVGASEAGVAFAWIEGRWCAQQGADQVDEYWLPPVAGAAQGLSRTVRNGRVVGFEFMRIETRDGVPTFLAQPQGRAETAFPRTAGGVDWVRFENPVHDFPDRIEYRRDGDALQAAIEGPGRTSGARARVTFEYRRCGDATPPEVPPAE